MWLREHGTLAVYGLGSCMHDAQCGPTHSMRHCMPLLAGEQTKRCLLLGQAYAMRMWLALRSLGQSVHMHACMRGGWSTKVEGHSAATAGVAGCGAGTGVAGQIESGVKRYTRQGVRAGMSESCAFMYHAWTAVIGPRTAPCIHQYRYSALSHI